jgi:hypothetical protein
MIVGINLTPQPSLHTMERGSNHLKIGVYGERPAITTSHPSPRDGEGPGVRFP